MMYFDLIEKLKGHMDTDPIINTTTKGISLRLTYLSNPYSHYVTS